MFLFISRYFWAIALGTTAVNTCAAAWKAQKHIASDPSLGEGYRRMLKHYAFWMSLPWMVMGVGIVSGGIPSVFHFFRPRDGNPYVLTFHLTVICLWILSVVWIYLRGGAEMLVRYPAFIRLPIPKAWAVKAFVVLCLCGGVAGEIAMWTMDIPIINFQ